MAGQTLSEIRALLAASGLAPRHRYGQNFLIDLNLMRKLAAAAELSPEDVVLEVGCGTGSLTEMLLETGCRVVGVEIDHGLQAILREHLGEHPRFTLIQGDALAGKHEINPLILRVLAELGGTGDSCRPRGADATRAGTQPGRYKLVANLPYQVATPLLMELLQVSPPFERLCCTIQKEVAERFIAKPGTDAYGPVSIVAQTFAATELIAICPPSVFWPRPEVESVMLCIRPQASASVGSNERRAFAHFVQQGFVQRRKVLRKAAERWGVADVAMTFARAGVNPDVRPEALAPSQWLALYQAVGLRSRP